MVTEVRIEEKVVKGDPDATLYYVELDGGTGVWRECFGSRELLRAFLTGVKALAGVNPTARVVIPPEYQP